MSEADLIPMLVLSRAVGLFIVAIGGGFLYGILWVWNWIARRMEEKKHGANKEN